MNTYKAYDPDGNAVFFNSLTAIKNALELTNADVKKIFANGAHLVSTGDYVITLAG